MAELTVDHHVVVERPIESLTLTLTEDEARAVLNVLTTDSPKPYTVRMSNEVVYNVIELLEDTLGEDS